MTDFNLKDYLKAEMALHEAAVAFAATGDEDAPSIREARTNLEQAAENYAAFCIKEVPK